MYVTDSGSIPSFDALNNITSSNQEVFGVNYQVYPQLLDVYYNYMERKYVVKCGAFSSTDVITDLYVCGFDNSRISIDEDNRDAVMTFIVNESGY